MNKQIRSDQRGIVSLMVTMILMLVISLIVLGFAQVARRNEREALDRQLSSQAYYAAEAGVNDVVSAISAGTISQANLAANKYVSNCSTLMTDMGVNQYLDSSRAVSYSCLLINSKPTSITYTTVAEQRAIAVPLHLNGNLTKLFFSWSSNGGARINPALCSGSLALNRMPTTWGCDYAMLQVDLVQPAALNAAALSAATNAYYLRPLGNKVALMTSAFTTPNTKASLVQSQCNAGTCSAELDFIGGASGTEYAMRIGSLYTTAQNIQVTGNVAGGLPATFSGAQYSVDSTGKSQDELRRIQVRLPIQQSDIPAAAIQSAGTLCKQFVLGNGLPSPTATLAGLCSP